ncbi:MAG: hypothetical protein NAOJABEB_03085 [Steroidobacteraceae bacterium]|nr:hypothetical protein [Steroidobacteraceae bacterium]
MRRRTLTRWFVPLLVLAGVWPVHAAEAGQATFVQVGRLLADPADGRVAHDKTIEIVDGRIVAIHDGFRTGAGETIDLRDRFVLPGLIDSHVHITFESGPTTLLDIVRKSAAAVALDALRYVHRTLEAGFTTIVDPGAQTDAILALRDAIEAGIVQGPRIIASGTVGVHGGHTTLHGFRSEIMQAMAHPGLCSGADDCRRAVRQAVQRGVDVIKVAATGGVTSEIAAGVGQQITDEELEAIVETAHALGRRVICHAHGTDGINAALRAGVDSIEHGTYLDAESIRLMKANGTYLVPTLLAGETTMAQARSASWMSPAVRQKALDVGPHMIDAARRAHDAGVKVAFGTDSSVSRHGENAREFALMLKAGFSPIEAIRAATTAGAAHNRLADQIGSLAAGKAADLIAVRSDPLQDITELERVTFVMKGGRVVKH